MSRWRPSGPDLFDWDSGAWGADGYPEEPGAKEKGGTSEEAALAIEVAAHTVRGEVLRFLQAGAVLTADEIAAQLGYSILTVRPRCSELFKMGLIRKLHNNRGQNRSGMMACRWEAKWKS